MKELILASSSPRRRELLSIITRRFTVQTLSLIHISEPTRR